MRAAMRLALVVLLTAACAPAYTRLTSFGGTPLRRVDAGRIQFFVNESMNPGILNSEGKPFFAPGSDPAAALQAAVNGWNNVATAAARFPALASSPASNDPNDNRNVLVFADSPELRSVLGSALAVTLNLTFEDGRITESDIVFNPTLTYSTNQAPNTYDLQSVAAHELGHALGANHSGLLSATMFHSTPTDTNYQARLSADDAAFLTDVYPAPNAADSYATLSGIITLAGGEAARGVLVVAIDRESGIVVGGITSVSTGAYSFKVPRGKYIVYTEPLDGPVVPGNLRLQDAQVSTQFQTTFLGGVASPRQVDLSAGPATADIQAGAGTPALEIQFLGTGRFGGSGDVAYGTGARVASAGQAIDLILIGPGLDIGVTQDDVRVLGAGVTVRPNSVRVDPRLTVNGMRVLRVTIDVAPRASDAVATVIAVKGERLVALSGALVIRGGGARPVFIGAAVVSAASFAGGGVAPGEIATLFGTTLGPSSPAANRGFDPATGKLPTTLGGTTVTFDGVAAPLFFVVDGQINLQVPYEVAGRTSTEIVVRFAGMASDAVRVPVLRARPGIFTATGGGQAILVNQDGTINGPGNPASRGSAVVLFATGQGMVSPPLETGRPAAADPLSSADSITATIGGVEARVLFGGMTPNLVGLMQVNLIVPDSAASGVAVSLQISAGGARSQSNVTMAVR